jgi:membrane protein YdbS with pleckstrin-like domain
MRTRRNRTASTVVAVIVLLWLLIGAIAAFQRGYFQGSEATCARTSTILVTVLAGPLNYLGVNPTIDCTVPQPSP